MWKKRIDGGEEVQLTRQGGTAAFESVDGKVLYYSKGFSATSLWKVPAEGGEETQILESLNWSCNFAVAKHGIYFTPKTNPKVGTPIQFFNFGTKEIKTITIVKNVYQDGLSVSPDAQWIIYGQKISSGVT